MKICGVELKGNDAIVCLMQLEHGLYSLPDCRVRRIAISDSSSREQLVKFQFDFNKLMQDYQVDTVVIRKRMTKGKFAGGSTSFKLEAAIQLIDELDVILMSSTQTKEALKKSHVSLNFKETGLKQFQEVSFTTAFAYLESN